MHTPHAGVCRARRRGLVGRAAEPIHWVMGFVRQPVGPDYARWLRGELARSRTESLESDEDDELDEDDE